MRIRRRVGREAKEDTIFWSMACHVLSMRRGPPIPLASCRLQS